MSVWRQRDFQKLWIGQTISETGSRITREGVPLTAVIVLGSSPSQMGVLAAVGSASVLLFGLGAGVIVDRFRKRPVMILTDLGRAALLLTVPLAAFLHRLSFVHLLTVAALTGILTVLFDVAYQSYLPVLVSKDDLLEGNRRLSMSAATAEMLGPALAGVLIQTITAPLAILLDACSFGASAISVAAIRKPEAPPPREIGMPLQTEILVGARVILAHPILRALLWRSLTAFLAMGLLFSLYMFSAIQVVNLRPVELGIAIALGGAGSLAGAHWAERVTRRFGTGHTFFGTTLLIGVLQLLIPLSAQFPRIGWACLCIQQFCGDALWMIYYVNETTLRQQVASEEVLGRVNAAMQLASRGMLPFGALAGGYLAEAIGIPRTLWLGALGILLSCLWLLPLRGQAVAMQS